MVRRVLLVCLTGPRPRQPHRVRRRRLGSGDHRCGQLHDRPPTTLPTTTTTAAPTTLPTTTTTAPDPAQAPPCNVGEVKVDREAKVFYEPGDPRYGTVPPAFVICLPDASVAQSEGFAPAPPG